MTAAWHFTRHEPGQPIINPIGGEHFDESDEEWAPGETLVRECIQNSLDARREKEVSVNFQIRPAPAMSAQTADYWFRTLWPHLRSRDCRLPNVPDFPSAGGFVVVEDFGTVGLEGDVRQGGLRDEDNRFFNFFRADGLSGNPLNGTSGGSWGVGKSVFNRCSDIHAFLALTVRRTENDVAVIGKVLLRHHRTSDGEFHAVGQFGRKEQLHAQLVLPESSEEVIRRLVQDFGLTRPVSGLSAEPGLSVVIPYADNRITAEGIKGIVIREYFHPILSGNLRVRVSHGIGMDRQSDEIHRDNIFDHASGIRWSAGSRVLDLAKWSVEDGPRHAYLLAESPPGKPPVWDEQLLRTDDPAFQELCSRFQKGEPVAIRVPLRVQRTGERPEKCGFVVYLQRDLTGPGFRPVFVRGCIVVPNAKQRAVRNQSIFALVTIEEGPLAVMLRAAEPPANTHWSEDTGNFMGRYEHGSKTINFVIGAPKFLADALSDARSERDLYVWADLFPLPSTEGTEANEGRKRKGDKKTVEPIDPPPPRPKPFKIEQVSGGFTVARDNIQSTKLPEAVEVRVAYDTSRGNPFQKYDTADFRLEKLNRDHRDIDLQECAGNRLVFRPVSDDFKLQVSGFDVNRDVIVKVSTVD